MQPTGLLKEHPSIPFNPLSSSLSEGQGVNLHDAVNFFVFRHAKKIGETGDCLLPLTTGWAYNSDEKKPDKIEELFSSATRQLGMKSLSNSIRVSTISLVSQHESTGLCFKMSKVQLAK